MGHPLPPPGPNSYVQQLERVAVGIPMQYPPPGPPFPQHMPLIIPMGLPQVKGLWQRKDRS